jgi:AraC-like DNA-binding protein
MLDRPNRAQKPLLHKSPLFWSGGVDSISAAIAPYLGNSQIELQRGAKTLNACLNVRRLQKTALCYGRFEQPFSVEIADSSSFLHGFPMRGSAQHVNNGNLISDSPARGAVGAPGPLRLSYEAGFEIFALFMSPTSLSSVLSAIAGWPVSTKLILDRSNYDPRPETPTLRGLARMLIAEFDDEAPEPSPVLLAELEQAAMVAFLCGTVHNHSHLFAAPVRNNAPWQIRRVEEYIEAHWDQPITVEALAILVDGSARTIFNSFKEFRGYSPMSFVRGVRLRHAREMLGAREIQRTVTEVAFACGFGNLGHFARHYFQVFGELPSATLGRAK